MVGKDVARNVVLVEQGDDHPALYRPSLTATDIILDLRDTGISFKMHGKNPLPAGRSSVYSQF